MSQGRAVFPDHGAGSGAITASRHLFSAVCSPRYAGSAHARPGRPICPWSSSRCWQGFQHRLDHHPAHAPVVWTLGTDVQGAQAVTRLHRVPGQRKRAKPGTRGCGQLPKSCPSGHPRGLWYLAMFLHDFACLSGRRRCAEPPGPPPDIS